MGAVHVPSHPAHQPWMVHATALIPNSLTSIAHSLPQIRRQTSHPLTTPSPRRLRCLSLPLLPIDPSSVPHSPRQRHHKLSRLLFRQAIHRSQLVSATCIFARAVRHTAFSTTAGLDQLSSSTDNRHSLSLDPANATLQSARRLSRPRSLGPSVLIALLFVEYLPLRMSKIKHTKLSIYRLPDLYTSACPLLECQCQPLCETLTSSFIDADQHLNYSVYHSTSS